MEEHPSETSIASLPALSQSDGFVTVGASSGALLSLQSRAGRAEVSCSMLHPPPSERFRLALRSAPVALVAVVALAGCGGGGGEERVATGAGAGAPAPAATEELPLLPPVEDRRPELFDDRGCLVTGPGEADCSTTAEQLDAGAAGAAESDERTLAGFIGSRWLEGAAGPSPVVLADTVTMGVDGQGRWTAVGLARNETAAALAAIEVRAVLWGADGTRLGDAVAEPAVRDVRSGEPVPFDVRSEVDAAAVAEVTWEVSPGGGTADVGLREVEIAVYWVRPEGAPEPVDLYLHRDEGEARPQALFGAATVVGASVLPAPSLVVAWVDVDGRVLAVDSAPVVGPTGEPVRDLAPGSAGDGLVLHDGIGGPALAGATPVVWGVGR